jgi:cytochrome P450
VAQGIGLYSSEAAQDPWPLLEDIRADGDVVWLDDIRRWAITSDRLSRRVLMNFERFTIEDQGRGPRLFGPEAFISMDDKPRHDELRAVWSVAFQRGSLEAMRGLITEVADRLIDGAEPQLRDGETVDMMAAVCRDLPAYVIAYMLGVPADMRPKVVEWSDKMGAVASIPPGQYSDDNPTWAQANGALKALADYLLEQIAWRRSHPGEDLVSQIVHSDVGRTLSDHAIMENARQLLFAGNETTAKWLGHCMVAFGRRLDVRDEINADRGLIPNAIEEVMRFEPVVGLTFRTLRGGDFDLDGTEIKNGQRLLVLTSAAGRDPERYADPRAFDIHRELKANLGFGYGMHSCLGVTLARLETQITLGRVLDRIPGFEVAGEVTYGSFVLRGPDAVPVRLS